MKKLSVVPILLLAAWLFPLAAQVGALLHLLDAGRHAHPPSMVEVLVHGHPHSGRVPRHAHTVCGGPAVPAVKPAPEASAVAVATPGSSGIAAPSAGPGRLAAAAWALPAAPLRHLLLVVLLR